MKKTTTSYLLLALVVLLAVGVAAAFAADPKASRGKLVLIGEGHEAETFSLEDLRDGESRTFQGKRGLVTVTRKGDSFEVKTESADAGEQTVVVTSGDAKDARVFIRKHEAGGEPQVMVLRHASGDEGLTWTAESGEAIDLKTLDGNVFFVSEGDGEKHRVLLRRVGEGGDEALVTSPHAHGFAWATGATDSQLFRCKDDDVIVHGPKEKFGTASPSCPVCGKLMEKLPQPPHKVIEVHVDKKSASDARPEI